jgi:hypothetical protein
MNFELDLKAMEKPKQVKYPHLAQHIETGTIVLMFAPKHGLVVEEGLILTDEEGIEKSGTYSKTDNYSHDASTWKILPAGVKVKLIQS